MKKLPRFLLFVLALGSMLISACGAAPFEQAAGSKVQANTVAYTGVIEAINGDQWTVNGQILAVDPSIVRDGPFQVGDTVKVEAVVNLDGSLTVKSVETPSAADLAASSPDPASGPTSEPGQQNDSAGGTEVVGTVESVTADTIVIDGKTFTVTNATEFKDQIAAGDFVKIHIVVNADGTVTIAEIEKADPTAMDDNSGSNSSSSSNSGASSSSSYDDDDSSHDSDEDQDSGQDDHDDENEDEDHSGSSDDD